MREGVSGKGSRHWRDNRTLGNRGSFSFFETGMHSETGAKVIASHLLVGPLREEDGGVYRCRVDFREAPTRNTRIKLNLIIPPLRPRIVSRATGEAFGEWTGPVREGATAALVCETAGGDPLPRISWWRGKTVIDDVVEEVSGGNALSMVYGGQAKV